MNKFSASVLTMQKQLSEHRGINCTLQIRCGRNREKKWWCNEIRERMTIFFPSSPPAPDKPPASISTL